MLAAAAWLGALQIQFTPTEQLEMEYQVLKTVINTTSGADATSAAESEVFNNRRLGAERLRSTPSPSAVCPHPSHFPGLQFYLQLYSA